VTESLNLLAEISIALLGFSGLMVALGRSSFPEAGIYYRVAGLLGSASIALLASLLPIVNVPFSIAAWFVVLVSASFLSWSFVPFVVQGTATGSNYALAWFNILLGAVITIWLLLSLIPLTGKAEFAYVGLIGFYLFLGSVFFIRLVLSLNFNKGDGGDA